MLREGVLVTMAAIMIISCKVNAKELSVTDKGWLMLIAQAEAEGEGVEGKAAVMKVVLNRVESERYPDTITEVIFEKNQFSTALAGGRLYEAKPDDECHKAVELIEKGWDKTQGAIFFNSCDAEVGKYLFKLGNHKFYK